MTQIRLPIRCLAVALAAATAALSGCGGSDEGSGAPPATAGGASGKAGSSGASGKGGGAGGTSGAAGSSGASGHAGEGGHSGASGLGGTAGHSGTSGSAGAGGGAAVGECTLASDCPARHCRAPSCSANRCDCAPDAAAPGCAGSCRSLDQVKAIPGVRVVEPHEGTESAQDRTVRLQEEIDLAQDNQEVLYFAAGTYEVTPQPGNPKDWTMPHPYRRDAVALDCASVIVSDDPTQDELATRWKPCVWVGASCGTQRATLKLVASSPGATLAEVRAPATTGRGSASPTTTRETTTTRSASSISTRRGPQARRR